MPSQESDHRAAKRHKPDPAQKRAEKYTPELMAKWLEEHQELIANDIAEGTLTLSEDSQAPDSGNSTGSTPSM